MKLSWLAHDGGLFPRAAVDGSPDDLQRGTATSWKMSKTLVSRSSASSTCLPNNNSPICQKPVSTNTQTLPIVLGVVIPVSFALILFIYLHRRNNKKQALEDANDPHKSLDFGVIDQVSTAGKKKGRFGGRKGAPPEMVITELGPDPMRTGKTRGGLSMDMLGSPYLLPAGLHGSGESLHSMSRAVHDEHDPYRPVTMMRGSSDTSRSPRPFNETGSIYSTNTFQTGNEKSNLVAHAQPPSISFPSRGESMSKEIDDFSTREMHSSARRISDSGKTSMSSSAAPTLGNISETGSFQHDFNKDPSPPLPPAPEAESFEQHVPPPRLTSMSMDRPPRKSSVSQVTTRALDRTSDASFYGDEVPPAPPKMMEPEDWSHGPLQDEPAVVYNGRFSIDTPNPSQQYPVDANRLSVMPGNPRRLSVMGLRPLPTEDPADNPEQRANRIRSFYKEYFDDSKPNPQNGFYEDWDPAYLDSAIYDPETGEYIYPNAAPPQAPFMQPMGRRAMTPPPGGLGRLPPKDHTRHFSTMSGGRAPGGRPGPRQPPKKKLPPPKPLMTLPTPSQLKTDDALYMAAELAPPTTFRELQNGKRPDSPGIKRPYSPSVKAYSPLVPAFDDLPAMPSPHHLRKSGTFTGLDFAAPRFQGSAARDSDAGSIRSARSGISAMQLNAVREGAYRVSRIPKEFVTSREDLSAQLRPKLNMISPA